MRILSLGAGVQSTVLALLAARGELEKVDCAIFADTKWEPRRIYKHLAWLKREINNSAAPFPVYTVSAGNIQKDLLRGVNSTGHKFITIPLFNRSGAKIQMGRRQCTREYKLAPLYKEARRVAGYLPRQRIPAGTIKMLLGITTDEVVRMKPARVQYIENCYPLIDGQWSRQACIDWFKTHYPNRELIKSACVGCPFRTNAEWAWLKNNSRREWRNAVRVDEKVRKIKPSMEQYLHSRAVPLATAVGDGGDDDQRNETGGFNNECEGMCGM